jgi:hypothetical protein
MTVSTAELARAREAAERLLESAGLEAYLYEVEPGDNGAWTIILECATDEGWQRASWSVDKRELLRSTEDETLRERLAAELLRHVTV